MDVWPGNAHPLGATWDGSGTNFALYSEVAERVDVCLFDDDDIETRVELTEVDAGVWHSYLPYVGAGQRYGYRVYGPWDPPQNLFCNPNWLLLDPYARASDGTLDEIRLVDPAMSASASSSSGSSSASGVGGLELDRDNAPGMPRSVVTNPYIDWGDDRALRRPWAQTVLYEVHVKGLTARHPGVAPEQRGTFAGLAHPTMLAHYRDLGVTALVLLPVQHFLDPPELTEAGLRDYWGLSTISYFAPEPRYGSSADPDARTAEFKRAVMNLHAAGLEVIVDIGFAATAEAATPATYSFRGIDGAYYRADVGGFDLRHPQVLQLLVDALRYWVQEMHVDGFRFPDMTRLARSAYDVDGLAPLLTIIGQDPALSGVKYLGPGWDVGPGGYQTSTSGFPTLWSEQNDRFSEWARDLWRGVAAGTAESHLRLAGSPDRYDERGDLTAPTGGVNFVSLHEGFTLTDLVSYDGPHNEANPSPAAGGEPLTRSWNCGVEGPTDDPAVVRLRARQVRNLIATVLLARGTPLLQAGDELGRTQNGNSATWCQDNELTWLDWAAVDEDRLAFVQRVLAVRGRHPLLGHAVGLAVDPGAGTPDTERFDEHGRPDRDGTGSTFQVFHSGRPTSSPYWDVGQQVDDDLLLVVHAGADDIVVTLPPGRYAPGWTTEIDTADDDPRSPTGPFGPGARVHRPARSVVLLVAARPAPAADDPGGSA